MLSCQTALQKLLCIITHHLKFTKKNRNRKIEPKREKGSEKTDGTKIVTVHAFLFFYSLTMPSTYKLAFQHPNNMCAITSSLPLTHRHTVLLTLHYKALQGNIKAQLSPKSFQCCRGGQKSECLSLSSLAHSLSKMETVTLSFPLSHFSCISPSLCLFLGESEVSVCVSAPAQLGYGHSSLRYISQEKLSNTS